MECFTADFLQFFKKKRQNLTFGWTAGYSTLNPNISGTITCSKLTIETLEQGAKYVQN